MEVHTNIPLKNYTTMRLGGNARFMVDVHSANEVADICASASSQQLPIYVLGSGSNTLVHDDGFAGVVVRNRIMGFDILEDTPSYTVIKVGAGENWDAFVQKTVDLHLSGVEALSAIPGTVGASPVQNIGAYGQEVSETITRLEAYDTQTRTIAELTNESCHFSYRNSIFRDSELGRYVILNVTFKLYKSVPQPPFYKALQDYLDQHTITIFTPSVIREAVTAIRTEKLPDPEQFPNTGSFFKNAIVESWLVNEIKQDYPDMPTYDMPGGLLKVPTGWLIEQVGLKGKVLHGMKVHDKNAVVLINESATSYADLAAARDEIIGAVRDQFRIQIEQEPLEISSLAQHV
jgi:UDP-N-acetylmuramate dehydrogenase